MFDSLDEITTAPRGQVIEYLEGMGAIGCDSESTDQLRLLACEAFEDERIEHEDFDASHMEDY